MVSKGQKGITINEKLWEDMNRFIEENPEFRSVPQLTATAYTFFKIQYYANMKK